MDIMEEPELALFVVELSLDGMPEFHDEFRVTRNAFKNAMQTYDALAELQEREPRLRIHCISTATDRNMDEIKRLSTFLFDRCPQMDHHNLAIIRGDRKDATLQGPHLRQYGELYGYIRRLWAPREEGRYGASVEPMLQWAKIETIQRETQFVPCTAGVLAGVVYANGDVSLCEIHEPIGNLRENSFKEIWNSKEAKELRESIARKECWCTTEIFMWPSIVYQPASLLRVMLGAKVWRKTVPLTQEEKVVIPLDKIGKIKEEPPDQIVQVNKPEEKM
jgi:MoaA/NifB/PqqE/SkfB family radical SAM enzyme